MINQGKFSEWYNVMCTENYKIERKTHSIEFKSGECYDASKINNNWWLIEQFGVSTDNFKKYFKETNDKH